MWSTLLEKLKGIGTSWTSYTAMGSFALYFLGYPVLRFQLSTWGVATDLSILDERYFFAGARFLVYLVSTVVNVLLLASPPLLIWWLLSRWARFSQWWGSRNHALIGVVFSVLFIQLVEKKCFGFMNSLLVQRQLEGERWLKAVLLDSTSAHESLFFRCAGGGRRRDRLATFSIAIARNPEAGPRAAAGLSPGRGVPAVAGELWCDHFHQTAAKGNEFRAR